MRAALDAGARIVNDVSALAHDPLSADVLAASTCGVVLMHMRGTPATMHRFAEYHDVAGEVAAELTARVAFAERAGIARARIAVDPGFGFAKQPAQSVELLRRLGVVAALGLPLVVGLSRKGFIGRLADEPKAAARDAGSLAAGLFALSRGASILRVHDVPATRRALNVWHILNS